MSDSFANVSFDVRVINQFFRPDWEKPANITVRHIPGSFLDDVQDAGTGNYTIEVTVRLLNDSSIGTLRSLIGITGQNLVLFGVDYGNLYGSIAMLIKVGKPVRNATAASATSPYWEVPLTFMIQGGQAPVLG